MKYRRLSEVKIEYTPEKKSEFVSKAKAAYDKLLNLGRSLAGKIENITIADILANPQDGTELLQKATEASKIAKTLHEQYFDIMEDFDVDELEDIVSNLDYLSMDLDNVKDAIEYLTDSAKSFTRLTFRQEDQT